MSITVPAGRAARSESPRSVHGEWEPAPDRADPVQILIDQAATRVPELVPVRYGRMLVSPFTFYRGAAAIMAADLAATPDSGITVQACGDAHILNFGGFAAPDRRLVFDVNDFDETLPAPWEWDVKRMAASIDVAGRDRAIGREDRAALVRMAIREYRETMAALAPMADLDVWYSRLDLGTVRRRYGSDLNAEQRANLRRVETKAKRKNSLRALAKLTETVDGRTRFISAPPLLVPVEELVDDPDLVAREVEVANQLLAGYAATLTEDLRQLLSRYRYAHMARKVVGVGSVGTRAWVILLEGRHPGDSLVLQAKEAQPSVLEPYAGASRYPSHGERVVHGQRLMQAAGDLFLGWQTFVGIDGVSRDFYLRQLWDWKLSVDTAALSDKALAAYVRMCAWTLARAHARSGDRVAIADYLGTGSRFDKAIAEFAVRYGDQNELDYAALRDAVASGRVPARTEQ